MHRSVYTYSTKAVACYFDAEFSSLDELAGGASIILITDENVYLHHTQKMSAYTVIEIAAGEEHKNQATVDRIIQQLIKLGATRNTFLIGVGGGVVTDLTGYVASVYMRGIKFGLVPTSV